MGKNIILITIVVAILSFIFGFLLANSLNRRDLNTLQGEVQRLKNSTNQAKKEDVLTPEELQRKIKEADENQNDVNFQKSLGFALYRYASLKQDGSLLPDILRILKRADKDKKDFEVLATLGNVLFDMSEIQNDKNFLPEALGYYQDALKLNPKDEKVLMSLTECQLAQGKQEDAEKTFLKLKEINPSNPKIQEIEKRFSEQKTK